MTMGIILNSRTKEANRLNATARAAMVAIIRDPALTIEQKADSTRIAVQAWDYAIALEFERRCWLEAKRSPCHDPTPSH